VDGLKRYLEGPGREHRPVTLVSTEQVQASALPLGSGRARDEVVEINILADLDGNLARQIDRDGYRYKFDGSEIVWTLIVE
jgi:hypothetical protein